MSENVYVARGILEDNDPVRAKKTKRYNCFVRKTGGMVNTIVVYSKAGSKLFCKFELPNNIIFCWFVLCFVLFLLE